MKAPLAALCFPCFRLLPLLVSPAAGKPLQSDSPPQRVFAVPGQSVVLPCQSASRVHAARVTAVEWSRVDGPSQLTVHAERDGQELVKEKATEYLGRTNAMDDGSLKLLGVTQQDSGTYRCVLVRGAATDEATVALIVGEAPGVSVILRRTPANDMLLSWESSGWCQRPRVSLLFANRTELRAQTTVWVGPDNQYSVRAEVDAATPQGNTTIICRVEIPGTSVARENHIYITDEFSPPGPDLGSPELVGIVSCAAVSLAFALVVVVFFVPTEMIKKLRTLLKRQTEYGQVSILDTSGPSSMAVDSLSINEYGDITQVSTTGSSSRITVNGQHLTGVKASHELARRDLQALKKYKEELIRVGNKLGVHPAVIAGIISRQSKFGTFLKVDGYGQGDSSSFGLMQINKHYHAIKGSPYSEEHLDQGVTFLIQLIKTMRRHKRDWTKEQQLKGALACYISSEEKVLPLSYEELDTVTPHGDFASDVVARAQWFAQNAFNI